MCVLCVRMSDFCLRFALLLPFVCLCVCRSVVLPVYLAVCCLPVSLSLCLPIGIPVCLSIDLSGC